MNLRDRKWKAHAKYMGLLNKGDIISQLDFICHQINPLETVMGDILMSHCPNGPIEYPALLLKAVAKTIGYSP